MKSNKQRRAEIMARREKRKARSIKPPARVCFGREALAVDQGMFPPPDSYRAPFFAVRGYYLPHPFTCRDCGKTEVWTAAQQKWWYEKALGGWRTAAVRCRPCRALAREAKLIAINKTKQGLVNHENRKQNR
jgi:Probable zinc-ribbon domain